MTDRSITDSAASGPNRKESRDMQQHPHGRQTAAGGVFPATRGRRERRFAAMPRRIFSAGTIGLALGGLALGLAGCASYQPLQLPARPNLAPGLAQLDLVLPSANGKTTAKLNPAQPLTPDEVGLVAVLNNPDLAAQRGKLAGAQADLLQAQLLPNPSLSFGYAFLISGPADADAVTASISQDIRSIITYRQHVKAATARFHQVGADALWNQWQVAQKARLLAIDIHDDQNEIGLHEQELKLLQSELAAVHRATAAATLDITAEAPLLAAQATADRDLAASRLTLLKDWQDLDALLGLEPTARFTVAAPAPVTLPDNIDAQIASLPSRRPDLVALRLGYDASEADVRAAILGQFPALSIGPSGGSDTTQVVSVGPQITMDLPIFDRNQGKIASTQATRLQLHAEYQARLDSAEGTARGLLARARVVEANLARARTAAASAVSLLNFAQRAYGQGNLNQRDMTDYETTALDRQLDVLGYERTLEEDALALAIELGTGFPKAMIASSAEVTGS